MNHSSSTYTTVQESEANFYNTLFGIVLFSSGNQVPLKVVEEEAETLKHLKWVSSSKLCFLLCFSSSRKQSRMQIYCTVSSTPTKPTIPTLENSLEEEEDAIGSEGNGFTMPLTPYTTMLGVPS